MKSVILLSGGLDSLVVAALFRRQHPDSIGHAVHVSYGQRPEDTESKCARAIARQYGLYLEHCNIDLPYLEAHPMFDPNVVICDSTHIQSDTHVIPMRNLIFLGVAASVATSVCADRIWCGFDFTPSSGSAADKSPPFVKAFESVLGSLGSEVLVEAPLQGYSKDKIVRIGDDLGVKWSSSWSCYNDFISHCGMCGPCVERRRSLRSIGVDEPYETPDSLRQFGVFDGG